MVLKQLNKLAITILVCTGTSILSQMKMLDLGEKEFSINSKTNKSNIIKILDNNNYKIYYILNKKDFDLKKNVGTNGIANIIFFSKKYKKGILANFRQSIFRKSNSLYSIVIHKSLTDNYMFIPSMIIVDQDFNYKYFMKYYYIPLPPPNNNVYKSSLTIQSINNYCETKKIDLKGNILAEDIDYILSDIPEINHNTQEKNCESIIYDIDLKDFFPKRLVK